MGTNQRQSLDPAALAILERAAAEGDSTAFSRVDEMKPCPVTEPNLYSWAAGLQGGSNLSHPKSQ